MLAVRRARRASFDDATTRRPDPETRAAMKYPPESIARFNANPLYRAIGIRLDEVADGSARATLDPTADVCWPTPGQPHGGILFTTMDTTMAFAALSTASHDSGCATVDCNIQYPAPARHGPFACRAATTHRTGRTVFVRAEIVDARGALVAIGQATFRIIAARQP
jgi:uncharacterized protein (TIGR00369 family)